MNIYPFFFFLLKKLILWKVSIFLKSFKVLLTEAVLSGAGKESGLVMHSGHSYLGIVPTANHRIPSRNIYTAWMADQVIVNSSHISILVSCHRAINVMEYGILITIQLTIFEPGTTFSKEDIQRDLTAVKNKDTTK